MRTDSNTVLSLSSGVLPKSSKSPLVSQGNGAAFEDDLNRAKEVVSPKAPPASADSENVVEVSADASDASTATASPNQESTSSDEDYAQVVSEESSEGEIDDSTSHTAESGKVLQFNGDKSPDLSKETIASLEELTSPELSLSSEGVVSLEAGSLKKGDSADSSEESTQGVLPSISTTLSPESSNDPVFQVTDDLAFTNEGHVSLDGGEVTGDRISSDTVDGALLSSAGVLGEKWGNTRFFDKSGSSLDVKSMADDVVALAPLSAVETETSVDEDGQLSWVLSQMGGATKLGTDAANPVAPNAINATDAAKSRIPSNIISTTAALSLGEGLATDVDEVDLESIDEFVMDDGLLANEPIELRKKEQEAMIGRMSAQLDGKAIDVDSIGGLNSSLQNNTAARAATTATAAANVAQANLAMNVPPNHPGWASEMTQKVAWVARDGGHTAHIRLDPPELGSLTVKISVDNDSNTQVSFVAATPQARDLLEGQMSRLRDMLAQQGMDLSRADVDVSQQDTSGMQRESEQSGRSNRNAVASQDEIDEDLISNNMSYVSATGVDYYA